MQCTQACGSKLSSENHFAPEPHVRVQGEFRPSLLRNRPGYGTIFSLPTAPPIGSKSVVDDALAFRRQPNQCPPTILTSGADMDQPFTSQGATCPTRTRSSKLKVLPKLPDRDPIRMHSQKGQEAVGVDR